MSHTPGPWAEIQTGKKYKYGISQYAVVPGDQNRHGRIANVFDDNACQALANARLIAAAPDLLAALKAIVGSPAEFDDDRISYLTMQVDRGDLGNALAAIRTAEGKEKT